MWNETVKANCTRDRTNAERSIARPYRDKLNGLHANMRKISVVTGLRSKLTNKRNASLHGALLSYTNKTSPYAARRNFVIGNAAIYCTLVVQGSVLVEQP